MYYQISQNYSYSMFKGYNYLSEGGSEKFYEDKITDEKYYYGESPVKLIFSMIEDEPKFADIHFCSSGFKTNNILIVSNNLKVILEKLTLPPHRFYNAEIYASTNGGATFITSNYYVLHFIYNYLQEIDFSMSQFGLIWFGEFNVETNMDEKFLKVLEEGEIKNLEEYWRTIEETKKTGNYPNLFPVKLKYNHSYDLLGERSFKYFSEELKRIIEENSITGVQFRRPNINIKLDANLDDIMFVPEIIINK